MLLIYKLVLKANNYNEYRKKFHEFLTKLLQNCIYCYYKVHKVSIGIS